LIVDFLGRLRSSYVLKNIIWVLILEELILVLKYLILLMTWHQRGSSIRLRARCNPAYGVEAISKQVLVFRLHFLLVRWLIIYRLPADSACYVSCRRCPNCLKPLIWINIFYFLRVSLLYWRSLSIIRLYINKIIFLNLYWGVYCTIRWVIILLLYN
jgi:hypothetical protein